MTYPKEINLLDTIRGCSLALGIFVGGVSASSDAAEATTLKELTSIPTACNPSHTSPEDRTACVTQFGAQLKALTEHLKKPGQLRIDIGVFEKSIPAIDRCTSIVEWLPKHGKKLERVMRYVAQHQAQWFKEYATRIKQNPENLKNLSSKAELAASALGSCGMIVRGFVFRESHASAFDTHTSVIPELLTFLSEDLQRKDTPLPQRTEAAQLIVGFLEALNAAAGMKR